MPLSRLFTFMLIGMMFFHCSHAKRVSFLPGETAANGGVDSVSGDGPLDLASYGDVAGVMLNYERTLEHVLIAGFLNPTPTWNYFELHRRHFLVLDPKNEELGTFTFTMDRGDYFEVAQLYMHLPDGQTKTFNQEDLHAKVNGDGSTTFRFAYPGLVKGTVIDEQLEVRRRDPFANPPLYHDVPLQFEIPCRRVAFSYAYPAWWEINIKDVGEGQPLDLENEHDSANKKRIVRYERRDVPAVTEEPMSPWFKEKALYAELMVTKLKMGEISYSAAHHWEALGKEVRGGLKESRSHFSNRVDRVAAKVTDGLDNDRDKLDAIVTYVQENIDAEGGRAGKYAKILAEKRGNPFMNTALTMELLRAVSIKSEFLMVHSAADGFFDRRFISSGQFTFPALRVVVGDRQYFVLPYIKGMPIDHLPQSLQGQHALLTPLRGQAALVKIPEGNLAENGETERLDLVLREDGAVEVHEHKTLKGSRAVAARSELIGLDAAELDKTLRAWLTFEDGAVGEIETAVAGLNDHKQPLHIKLTYHIDNALVVTPEEVLFRPSGLFRALNELPVKTDARERRSDVVIPFDLLMEKNVSLSFPDSWRLVDPPAATKLTNQFGEVKAEVVSEPGRFSLVRRVTLNKTRQDKSEFAALLDLVGAGQDNLATLVFEKQSAP